MGIVLYQMMTVDTELLYLLILAICDYAEKWKLKLGANLQCDGPKLLLPPPTNISSLGHLLMKVKFVTAHSFYCCLEGMTAVYVCTGIDISGYCHNMNILGRWPTFYIYLYPKMQFSFPFQKLKFINFVFPGKMLQDWDTTPTKHYMGWYREEGDIYLSLNQHMFQRKFMRLNIDWNPIKIFFGKLNILGLLSKKIFKSVKLKAFFCNYVLILWSTLFFAGFQYISSSYWKVS
jgi:hypothetical protein